MVNLSRTFVLSQAQISLLSKGLSFVPTRGSNRNLIYSTKFDLQEYHRRIKLAAYFEDRGKTDPPPPFTLKSTWAPPSSALPEDIRNLIHLDSEFFLSKFKLSIPKPNLNKLEIEALNSLKENTTIVIKPADKGSAVVVMDRDQYIWEGHRQLMDTNYYRKLEKPIYLDTVPMVQEILQKLHQKKIINVKQKNYLIGNNEPRPRQFYLLPKIHKSPDKWSKPHEIPPGRPIVSDCGSETYFTAEFLDSYLNPLSTRHSSYLRDTYDFISKIKQLSIPPSSYLFTMDVESLYTNIDITEGISAVKNIFFKYPDSRRPDRDLLELLKINLTRNDFQFNNQFFLQIKGTAMGKKFAPAYANIFMAEWEESALQNCLKKPLYYYRYLDDVWGVWTHSQEDFEAFVASLNSHNNSIKVKATVNPDAVDFLDTTTFKGPEFLQTTKLDIKVFFKETDTHALLFKSSFHPRHTYAGIVKSQLLRFDRICTRSEDFMTATRLLFSALSRRGYGRSFLRKCLKTFRISRPASGSTLLPIVINYSKSTVNLIRQIKQNFNSALENSNLLQSYRPIAAFRRHKNLKDLLVRAKLPPLDDTGFNRQDSFYKHRLWVQNKYNRSVFKTQMGTGLDSRNCTYLISCTVCGIQYVGETRNSIRTRFYAHKYNITRRKNMQAPVTQHFIVHGWAAVMVTVLECNPHWSTAQRRRSESRWIQLLSSTQPYGLNLKH